MKKTNFMRFFILLLILALFAPLLVQGVQALSVDSLLPELEDSDLNTDLFDSLSPGNAAFNSLNGSSGAGIEDSIFWMVITDGEDGGLIQAFYVEDTQGDGSTYLVTSFVAGRFVEENGWDAEIIGQNFRGTADYVTTVGYLSFFTVPGLEACTPLKTGAELSSRVQNPAWQINDGKSQVGYREWDISNRQEGNGYFAISEQNYSNNYFGTPIIESKENGVVGCVIWADSEQGLVLITSMIGLEFPSEAAIVKGSTQSAGGTTPETTPQAEPETQPQAEQETQPRTSQGQEGDGGKTGTSTVSILVVVAAIAVAVFAITRRTSGKKEKGESSAVEQGTVSLDPQPIPNSPEVQPVPDPVPKPTPKSTAKFQVRGIGGIMNGRVFLLNGPLRFGRSSQCGVVFPQDAPGISGLHCTLAVEDGRAVLRDEESSYGTYLGKNVKMEPGVSYNLQPGDVFTLAEGGQSFRLENAGASVQELTPAVRAVDGGRVYRADLKGRIAFGRDPQCQVAFDANDSSISANHCILYREGNVLYLMDNGSTNGTFLGEKERLRPKKPYRVSKGQAFFLCSPQYTFVIIED